MAPGTAFCSVCGANLTNVGQQAMPGAPSPVVVVQVQQRTSGMAIAGFVLSFFCGLLGLIFSVMGRNECKRSNGSVGGAGLAVAGIVISILHLVASVAYVLLVFVFVARVQHQFGQSKNDIARATAKSIAYEAYPQWSTAHPNKQCPDSITDLGEYMNDTKMTDPWGGQYQFLCGPTMPQGSRGVLAISAGEDGAFNTADDVKSTDD
jgi:hypothetical protein